ncbi:hypothetical protein [Arthrobacter sp. H-02-3]|uniref:hypothetical protein n=1 Tax=Arthrobacter sp. H-02-3 TaxID=2703675 RepID=UPI000DD1F12D|nr:hypothetical protein [Arthrobacter sp. H-02-3]PVZ60838.1 hypothetical protein C9424_00060 [Arthrobacter sp. H-02-3]
MPSAVVQYRAVEITAHRRTREARLAAALASCRQSEETLRTQLRSQSADLDHQEAENTEQRTAIEGLRAEVIRFQTVQRTDAQDLIHLAGRLLALSHASGVGLDNATKDLFRRRGWTASARKTEVKQQ